MNTTGIEYLDMTWNPTTGCTPVSAGCEHCWAMAMTERNLWGYDFTPRCHPDRLLEPLRRRKPARIGVSFMGDLFHDGIPDEFIDRVFAVMAACLQHTFQVLTKRPERMLEWFTSRSPSELSAPPGADRPPKATAYAKLALQIANEGGWRGTTDELLAFRHRWEFANFRATPLPNVWLGVTAEDQATADERIPLLLQCPAAVRYVSLEPLLEGVDLRKWLWKGVIRPDTGEHFSFTCKTHGPTDWVIVGGESGPGARPMHPDWVRSIRDQCKAAGVPLFFKQWGAWAPADPTGEIKTGDIHMDADGRIATATAIPTELGSRITWDRTTGDSAEPMRRVGKHHAGRLLDGVVHDAVPGQESGIRSQDSGGTG